VTQIQVTRDGRQRMLTVRLGERPSRQAVNASDGTGHAILQTSGGMPLGMTVRDIDRDAARRLRLPEGMSGALVTRVDPMSAGWDAGIQRDNVVLEINRRPVTSADSYTRMAKAARPGDVLALYIYVPGLDQRAIRAVRVDAP
jgi:serine protease Do